MHSEMEWAVLHLAKQMQFVLARLAQLEATLATPAAAPVAPCARPIAADTVSAADDEADPFEASSSHT